MNHKYESRYVGAWGEVVQALVRPPKREIDFDFDFDCVCVACERAKLREREREPLCG